MRIALLFIATLAIATASASTEDDRIAEEAFASTPFSQDNLLQEQTFAEASSKLESTLLQMEDEDEGKVLAKPGFHANFYANVRVLNVPQAINYISSRKPNRSFTVSRIRYGSTVGHWSHLNNSFRDHFVGKFTGSLRVARTGTYNFWTVSDDGSRAYVNGRLVVNNDGLHGMRTRHGRVHLKKGYAPIQVYFFERTGGAGLYVDWSGPGFSRRPIASPMVYTSRPPVKVKKGPAGCIDNAKKSINSIIHEVKNAQSIINRMDNGKHCSGKGQKQVKDAMRSLSRKQQAEKQAQKNYNNARNARVNVSVTFSSGNRNCNVFTNSAQWRRARRNVARKKNAWATSKTRVRDAQKYLTRMKEKARQDRCKCKTRVENAAQGAVTQARKLTAERKKSIIRELMLICLVKARSKKAGAARNNAGQACKRQGLPSKFNAKLALHKTKLVSMAFKCKRCGGVYCTSARYERYHKERTNKERSSKERTNKERAQKAAAASRERAQKERATKERSKKNSWRGKSFVSAYGYGWRTLGGWQYNGPSRYCDNTFKNIPRGCNVAPDNWQSRTMAKRYCWSTSVVVFSNGNSWGASCYGSNHWNYNMLSKRYYGGRWQAKANSCTLAVLLRCPL